MERSRAALTRLVNEAEQRLQPVYLRIAERVEYNQKRVLQAFQDANVQEHHFH
jgi:cystathionine beta-lyase family protein involved in aluminum resistance